MRNRYPRPWRRERPPEVPQLPLERDPTLKEAGDRWLASYIATMRSPKNQRLARTRFENYALEWLGDLPIRKLDGDHIRQYRQVLERHWGLSANSVTHLLSDLRCFLRWAVSARLIDRSPFPSRVMPRIQESAPHGFSEREVVTLESLPGRAGFVLRFLIGTGLRWGEACRATPEHVRGALLEVGNTKSGRLRRVPLGPELMEEIAGLGEGRLVPYAVGSPGSFSRRVKRLTGIASFHPHRCRHTFAMRWLASGGNLAVLQHILGHRDLSTTMRYARVTDELIEREAARLRGRVSDRES